MRLHVAFQFCVYRRPLQSHVSPPMKVSAYSPSAKGTQVTKPEKPRETICVKHSTVSPLPQRTQMCNMLRINRC